MQTLKDFYNFYKEIPEDKWCTGQFMNTSGQCCARGHLGERDNVFTKSLGVFDELASLNTLLRVNDDHEIFYKQPTPKLRVLAFLKDQIIEKEDSTFKG